MDTFIYIIFFNQYNGYDLSLIFPLLQQSFLDRIYDKDFCDTHCSDFWVIFKNITIWAI